MSTHLTSTLTSTLTEPDAALLGESLALLQRAGVRLADEVEIDDVEDALLDELESFRAQPVATLAALRDPDDNPMFARVWCDLGPAPRASLDEIHSCADALCLAAGTELTEFVVFPDPDSASTGSLRLRAGAWDVADVGYDLGAGDIELGLISATVPAGITAVTLEHEDLDARSVTLFLTSGDNAVTLVNALEDELG